MQVVAVYSSARTLLAPSIAHGDEPGLEDVPVNEVGLITTFYDLSTF